MSHSPIDPLCRRPATWAVVLAFGVIYLSWGTTYFAIREGVKTLPPALFAGLRIGLAGLVLLGYLRIRGEALGIKARDLLWTALGGSILFIGGNGLITVAEITVPSGVASVLAATTPLWMALLEWSWPWGERLSARGWLGLVVGLAGVLLLLAPKLGDPGEFLRDTGPLMVLGSAASWALGSLLLRYRRSRGSHLSAAAWQMLVGGCGLTLLGLLLGEAGEMTPDRLTPPAVLAFFYLLIVGSLIGFTAYNWLLGHVPAAMVGTYAYVNPLVAILVGWLLGGEELTAGIVGGMVVILAGVALVRGSEVRSHPKAMVAATDDDEIRDANHEIRTKSEAEKPRNETREVANPT